MKRSLSLVLALVMILGSFSTVFAAKSVTTEAEAGAFLKAAGVLVGDEKGDLNLKDNLLRQDAVILVAQLRGEIKAAQEHKGLPTYEDVKIKFYNAPLAWAQENGLFVGHSDKVFGFGENLTAQEYAKVLLSALGYKVAPNGDSDIKWADVLTKAQEFGILENVKVENGTEISRGEMALMTFNALGVNMKGLKKTLAETLGIEMPEVEVKELKAEVKDTENLKEVVVELSNAKLADAEKLAEVNNYKLTGNVVVDAEVVGNDVVLLLKDSLVKGREYELVIRNIDKAINKKYTFKANDNTIPAVEEVTVLGEYGIKVTTTEPIDNARERNFIIDGKNVSMKIEQYGRDIILTPYYKDSFSEKAETLTIKELVDFAGYKSVEKDFEIKIVKDTVAPKVVDVISKGNKVEVIFDKDIYADSVEAYDNRSNVGNISYQAGRETVYATDAEKVTTNKVVYTFKDELARRTDVTIVDVANHSKGKMEKTTMEARIVLDYSEPEIIEKKVTTDHKANSAEIKLYFDKDVKGSFVKDSETEFVAKDHFTVYEREVYTRNIKEGKITSVKYDEVKGEIKKDVIVVKLTDLTVYNSTNELDYILEVVNFTDATSLKNKMYRDYVDFKVSTKSDFKVTDIYSRELTNDTEIVVEFSKSVDRVLAENPANYIFIKANGTRSDVKDLKGKVWAENNGKTVIITLPNSTFEIGNGNGTEYKEIRILDAIKDKDGNRVVEVAAHDLTANFTTLTDKAIAVEGEATALLATTSSSAITIELTDAKKELVDLKVGTPLAYTNSNHAKLVKAIEKVEKAIEKVKKANDSKLEEAKTAARTNLRNEIKTANAKLVSTDPKVSDAGKVTLTNAIAAARLVLDSSSATTANLVDATTNLVAVVGSVK